MSWTCARRHATLCTRGLCYEVCDARSTPFADAVFGGAVDKGLLDAALCSEGFDYEAGLLAGEVARLLSDGGVWVSLSLSPPSVVLPLLSSLPHWASLDTQPHPSAAGVFSYVATRAERRPAARLPA